MWFNSTAWWQVLRDDTSSLCQTIATFYMLICQKKAVLIMDKERKRTKSLIMRIKMKICTTTTFQKKSVGVRGWATGGGHWSHHWYWLWLRLFSNEVSLVRFKMLWDRSDLISQKETWLIKSAQFQLERGVWLILKIKNIYLVENPLLL